MPKVAIAGASGFVGTSLQKMFKENGFDVTLEGLETLAKELQPKEELDEDELDQVAGGFFALEAVLVAGIVAATAGAVAMSAQVGIASSKNW